MQQPANQQRADVDGQGNIIVQIVGESNRVMIAGACARYASPWSGEGS